MLKRIGALFGCALLLGFADIGEAHEIIVNGFGSFYGRSALGDGTTARENGVPENGVDFSTSTKIGLNLRANFSPGWSVVGQAVAAQRASGASQIAPRWAPEFDWFYVGREIPDSPFSVKVGRQLFPGSLTAEYLDVGLTYPWRTTPASFQMSSLFKSFEGVSGAYHKQFGDISADLRIYGGGSRPSDSSIGAFGYDIKDLIGATSALEGDGWTLQGSYAQYRFNFIIPVYTTTPTKNIYVDNYGLVQRFMLGARYDKNDIVVYSEYSHLYAWQTVGSFAESYYATLGYRLGQFLPHITHSYSHWTLPDLKGIDNHVGLGLNYEIDSSVVMKAEYLRQNAIGSSTILTRPNELAQSVALGLDFVF